MIPAGSTSSVTITTVFYARYLETYQKDKKDLGKDKDVSVIYTK